MLLTFPTLLLVLLIVGGSVALAVLATYLVRRFIPEKIHQANNEVAGFMFAGIAVVYGVLLAFMVLVVWQGFENAQDVVEREANTIVDIYRVGQELPSPYDADLKVAVVDYTQKVILDEWRQMEYGQNSTTVGEAQDQLWTVHRRLDQDQISKETHKGVLFSLLENLGNERRTRLLNARSELPGLMWVLLCGGAIVTVAFTLFFRVPSFRSHLLMSGMFAGLLAFVLFLIIELDSPFTGAISIQPLAFQQALELILHMQGK